MPLLRPDGNRADSIDRVMLLVMWASKLAQEKNATLPPIISAGMGKPTFPISLFAAQSGVHYWNQASLQSQKARHLLAQGRSDAKTRNRIAKIFAAIDYGDPRGDYAPRAKTADALTRWYGSKVVIRPEHILFTIGGAGALHSIFSVINKRMPGGIIVTPYPHYGLYTGPQSKNRLFPIPVMEEKGYRLSAVSLSKHLDAAIAQAKKEGVKVSAILLCDPNNPLGTALDEDELQKIACILKNHPDIFIILDEAYAEIRLSGKHELSLLGVAPKLKDRIILMRSATKALSAAGERMAVIVAFNETIIGDLLQENVNVHGHAPRSLQYVFAEAIENLDRIELENLRDYYKPQVEYVTERLKKMAAAMPDSHYQKEGAFYVLADLSDLLGQEISAEAARALGKKGKITTDEELIYSLLFDNGVLIAPLSYFGVSNRRGYVRVTCSGGEMELEELMDRLEKRLVTARKTKQIHLENQLATVLEQLSKTNNIKAVELRESTRQALMYQTNPININSGALKKSNHALRDIYSKAKVALSVHSSEIKHSAATNLQAFFRGRQGRKEVKEWKNEIDAKWRACVNANIYSSEAETRFTLYSWPPSRRLKFQPWVEYLRKNNLAAPREAKDERTENPVNSSPRSRL
jgi:aspartate/methionine/tyrosine aminotransferase